MSTSTLTGPTTGGASVSGSDSGAVDTTGACGDACELGETRCNGEQLVECIADGDGCSVWGVPRACATGSCQQGQCVGGCVDQCVPGAGRCIGVQIQICGQTDDGCTDWQRPEHCPNGQLCSGGECVETCSDQCRAGETRCVGEGIQVCTLRDHGCTDWELPVSCRPGEVCQAGQCQCSNDCVVGASRCDGVSIQHCQAELNECGVWGPSVGCPAGQTCNGGRCSGTCTDQCLAGARQCEGERERACVRQANGCLDWNPAQVCDAGQSCQGEACACDHACTEGQSRCEGLQIQTCEQLGAGCYGWSAAKNCPGSETCSGGSCDCSDICELSSTRCDASGKMETCELQSNGCTDWGPAAACPDGGVCRGDVCVCTDSCMAGQTECEGSLIQHCALQSNGCLGMNPAQSCPPDMSCRDAQCACSDGSENCCGAKGEPCCAGRCDEGLSCGDNGMCGDPCEDIFRVIGANEMLIPGHRVHSPYVDPNQTYLWGRMRSSLQHIVDDELDDLSRKLVQLSFDGFFDLDELLKTACPDVLGNWTPEERARLPEFFDMLAFDAYPLTTVADQPVFDDSIENVSTRPTRIEIAPSTPIAEFGSDVQASAHKLQMWYDNDMDASSVSLEDCTAGIADTNGRFTSSDKGDFEKMIVGMRLAGVSNADARLRVPEPFEEVFTLADLTQFQIQVGGSLKFEERRRWSWEYPMLRTFEVLLDMDYAMRPEIKVQDEYQAVVLGVESKFEGVYWRGPTWLRKAPAGQYFVEIWRDHARVAVHRILLPHLETINRAQELREFSEYTLETRSGVELTKNLAYTHWSNDQRTTHHAFYSFDVGQRPPTGDVHDDVLKNVATPAFGLRPGRYTVEHARLGPVHIEVYKDGVMRAVVHDERFDLRMRHSTSDDRKKFSVGRSTGSSFYITFDPQRSPNLRVTGSDSDTEFYTLDSTMRE